MSPALLLGPVPTVPLLSLQVHHAAGDAGLTGECMEGSPWDREEVERYGHRWAPPDLWCQELRLCPDRHVRSCGCALGCTLLGSW